MLRRQRIVIFTVCFAIVIMFSKCGFLVLERYLNNMDISDNSYVMSVAETRGNIYDRNGEKLVNDEQETTLLIKPDVNTISFLRKNLSTDSFLEIQQSLLSGQPTKISVKEKIFEQSDIVNLTTYKRYSEDNLLRHIIGYTDINGDGVCGIEKSFNDILKHENREIVAKFSVSATGEALIGEKIEINENDYYSPDGVQLTIDKDMQIICEDTLDSFNVEKGAAVLLDANTFEVLAMVSRPTYNSDNIETSLYNEQYPLINRALSAYPTGSVFKIVVAATALEEKMNPEYECTGKIEVGRNTFHCHKEDGHGMLDLDDAISLSCNTYFINLARELSKERIIETAGKLGFGESIRFCEGIVSDSGNLPTADDVSSPAALANLSFGQGELTSTPLQIAAMTAVVANGGQYIHPSLILGTVDEKGKLNKTVSEASTFVLSEEDCDFLKLAMVKAANEGTGKKANPINTSAGVKTSTAEKSDGSVNSWLTGFFPKDNPKYVLVIMKEDGISGGEDCGPIFKKIAEKITLLLR